MMLERKHMQLEGMEYDILQVLGKGAFATVYLIRDQKNGRTIACKVSEHTELLQREAKILQQITHPLFPRYEGFVSDGQTGYLLQEAVEGRNLRQYMEENGRIPAKKVLQIAYEISDGLEYLHECPASILFLDIKPDHIILQPDGKVRMVDLGSAAYCGSLAGIRTGTEGYSAPEQLAQNEEPAEASDIYGLAATMWYLLTGTLLETYRTQSSMHGRLNGKHGMHSQLRDASLNFEVYRFLTQCLQYNMENRMPSMCYFHYKVGILLQKSERNNWLQCIKAFAQNRLPDKLLSRQSTWIFQQNVVKTF